MAVLHLDSGLTQPVARIDKGIIELILPIRDKWAGEECSRMSGCSAPGRGLAVWQP